MKFVWLSSFVVLCLAGSAKTEPGSIGLFHAQVEVQENGELKVTERLHIHVDGHYINQFFDRWFPVHYAQESGPDFETPFDVISVQIDNAPVHYTVESINHVKHVRLGTHTALFPRGEHVFELVYTTSRQIFDNGYAQYLDYCLTGEELALDIMSVRLEIDLPKEVHIDEVIASCGGPNSSYSNCSYKSEIKGTGNQVVITSDDAGLRSRRFDFALVWSNKHLPARNTDYGFSHFVLDNKVEFYPGLAFVLALIYYLAVWKFKVKGKRKKKQLPLKSPPSNLSPALAAYAHFGDETEHGATASLLSIAQKGGYQIHIQENYLELEESEETEFDYSDLESTLYDVLFRRTSYVRIAAERFSLWLFASLKVYKQYQEREIEASKLWTSNLLLWIPGAALCLVGLILGLNMITYLDLKPIYVIGIVLSGAMSYATFNLFFTKASKGSRRSTIGVFITVMIILSANTFFGASYLGFKTTTVVVLASALPGLFLRLLRSPSAKGRRVIDELVAYETYMMKGRIDPKEPLKSFNEHVIYATAMGNLKSWLKVLQVEDETEDVEVPWIMRNGRVLTLGEITRNSDFLLDFHSAVSYSQSAPRTRSDGDEVDEYGFYT